MPRNIPGNIDDLREREKQTNGSEESHPVEPAV
jgi:hypothetical protein